MSVAAKNSNVRICHTGNSESYFFPLIKERLFQVDTGQRMFYCYYDQDFVSRYMYLKSRIDQPVFISIKVKSTDTDRFLSDIRLLYDDTVNIVPECLDIESYRVIFNAVTTDPSISVNIYLINVILFKFKPFKDPVTDNEAFYCKKGCFLRTLKNCRWSYLKTLLYPFTDEPDVQEGMAKMCRMFRVLSLKLSARIIDFYRSSISEYVKWKASKQTLLPVSGYIDPFCILD